jgi:hypothetical protein
METRNLDPSFTLLKPVMGYTWEGCEVFFEGLLGRKIAIPPPPYLVEKDYSQAMIVSRPLEDSTLFANFGDVEPDDQAYLQWADKHGMLVGGEKLTEGHLCVIPKNSIDPLKAIRYYSFSKEFEDERTGYAQLSESLQFWRKEHRELSFAVVVWELAARNDVKRLGKIIQWSIDYAGVLVHYVKTASIVELNIGKLTDPDYREKHTFGSEILFDDSSTRPWMSKLCRYPDVIKPALLYVRECINRKLQKYPINFISRTNDCGEVDSFLRPSSLLSAMWYQFHLVLT